MEGKTLNDNIVTITGHSLEGPVQTVSQFEDKHPALKGRMRRYIMFADHGVARFAGLRPAIIRVGRSLMLDEARVLSWLDTLTSLPNSEPRNPHGRAGKAQPQRRETAGREGGGRG